MRASGSRRQRLLWIGRQTMIIQLNAAIRSWFRRRKRKPVIERATKACRVIPWSEVQTRCLAYGIARTMSGGK